MKIQWNSMTDFAKRMFKRIGLTSLDEYHDLEIRYYKSLIDIDKLAKQRAARFPYFIEPEVQVIQHDRDGTKRIKLLTKNLQHVIDPFMLEALDNPSYKDALIRHLSNQWARQTEQVLYEIMEKAK